MKNANVAVFVPHAGCTHRCVFCDQRTIAGVQSIPDDETVCAMLTQAAENLGERARFAQIAFFGGSFTAISKREMLRLLCTAQPFLQQNGGVFGGIRISTRPDAIDSEMLDLLKMYGVTAIELGAQSMDAGVLAASARSHTAEDVCAASALIREAGFSLGLQMMTGLPLDTGEKTLATAKALADLYPDTMRIYPTLVLEGAPLAELWRSGGYQPQTLEDAVALGAELLLLFHQRGIHVIRVGLHDSPELQHHVLAGPYHPAFRELCHSAVLLQKAKAALLNRPAGKYLLRVAPGAQSAMAGQHKANRFALEQLGYQVRIKADPAVETFTVKVESMPS